MAVTSTIAALKETKKSAAISTKAAANESVENKKTAAGKRIVSTSGNPFPVQLTVDGRFPLGLTVELKNSLLFVKALTPGKQCEGKIHVADQVIYVDDKIIINSNDSITYFQHQVQLRRTQQVVFTITFLRYLPSHKRNQTIPHSLQVLTTNAMKAMKARGLLKYLNLDKKRIVKKKVPPRRGIIDPEPSSSYLCGKANMEQNQFVGEVIKLLQKQYVKRSKQQFREEFEGLNANGVMFNEINDHGCHTMTTIKNGQRVVNAAIIAERVQRKPDDENGRSSGSHFGLCIRFMSQPNMSLHCLLHRICTLVLWEKKLEERSSIIHIYLRYRTGSSLSCPKFFKMTIPEDTQQAFCLKYGFRDKPQKDKALEDPDDLWIEDSQVYIPVALDMFEKKFRNKSDHEMYRQCGGEELMTSPSVYASYAVKGPPPSNSFFYIDPHSIDEFSVCYYDDEDDVDTAGVFAHNKYLGWNRIDLDDFDTSLKIKSDIEAIVVDVIKSKTLHKYCFENL
jgi:hypothetical protein